ncbi:hypothetical protein GLOTRDRAFT_131701 [Gloeophyllum trabeum ATCC 11539]|uniref:Uncharacterized protein n=1 Tax=Gloeophyllum trabeum (strain ATCC 11539 / FP-39264 / Madison 617) TaxID=670483 RepID=S7RE37_GLOTA|nr:uncharacterized protein GLOTRDRAFT_131701 [Gloeophyllum trabeum ATCC 11539]EPQ52460.1 hypothetical protein GLOTRDRAFT_131701 [Gloeophyllum trabeum ATCC 11539]
MSDVQRLPLTLQHQVIECYLEDATPADRHDPYPYDECTRLMLVCHDWESFIVELTIFWKNITITDSGAMGRAIMWSGDEPLDICGRLIDVEEEEDLSRLDLLLQYRGRIRSLDLITSRMVLAQWDADRYTEVSVLEDLVLETIDGTHDDPETCEEDLLAIFKTSTLRMVELKGFTDREASTLMTKRVEVLRLQGMTFTVTDREYMRRPWRTQKDESIILHALDSMESIRRLDVDSGLFGETARYPQDVSLPTLHSLSFIIKTKEHAKGLGLLHAPNLQNACVEFLALPNDLNSELPSISRTLDTIPWNTEMSVARFVLEETDGLCITFAEGSLEVLQMHFHHVGELGTILRLLRYNLSRCLGKVKNLHILMHDGQKAVKKLETEALVLLLSGAPELRHLAVQVPMKPDDVLKPSRVELDRLESIAVGITHAEDARFLTYLEAPVLQHASFKVSAADEDISSILKSVAPHLHKIIENRSLPVAQFQLLGRTRHDVHITLGDGEGQLPGIDLQFKEIRAQAALLHSLATHVAPCFELVENISIRKGDGYAHGTGAAWRQIFEPMLEVRMLRVEGQGVKAMPSGLAYRDNNGDTHRPLFPALQSLTLQSVWFRRPKKKGKSRSGPTFIGDLLRSLECRDKAQSLNKLTVGKARKLNNGDIVKLRALVKDITWNE